jgi:formylglycine-generating enzyme required for sulfatase activity/tRNA A-37 threonylcarbamoyl transferase component Bud32
MSSAADPTAAFLSALQASRLLSAQQIADISAWTAPAHADVPALAKEINRRGWLSVYQIKEIARGRGKDLILGDYVIVDLIGEGGMGRVFKAHNTRLGRDEALKVIRADKLKQASAQARFTLEMQALGKVKHPNVVTAFDAGPIGDLHFVSMELIDGIDLTKMVRDRGPLPIPQACEYIRQAALGLQHALELGMVHRDIKPSNILVSRDGKQVKLVDLGLARLHEPLQEGANRVTQEGFVIGTPDFLAPEQARNPAGVDIRADIYALGATLFYIVTGRVPFDGANATEKLLKHCTDPPPPLLPFRPDASPQLEQVIQWCMAKRPEDRPQTPLQLAQALAPFCPPSPGGTGVHRLPPPDYRPPAPVVVAGPLPQLPGFAYDPSSSSQLFKLPAQSNDDDPIRRRARAGFPFAMVAIGLMCVILLGILGFAAYRALQPQKLPPVESFTNFADMKMVKIEGGSFEMGSPPTEIGRPEPKPRLPNDESPVHKVTIRGPFLMSATEVTHGQYLKVMGVSPARSIVVKRAAKANEHPAEFISYDDANEFCRVLTEKDKNSPTVRPGWVYRLPTEAEWEYCCRAGTETPFAFGDRLSNVEHARYLPSTDEKEAALQGETRPDTGLEEIPGRVAQFKPNAWGLYDMHGNVAEWCHDWYKRGYPSGDAAENPTGPATGERRVVRGGSFLDPASACRSAARMGYSPNERRVSIGFRVVYAPSIK